MLFGAHCVGHQALDLAASRLPILDMLQRVAQSCARGTAQRTEQDTTWRQLSMVHGTQHGQQGCATEDLGVVMGHFSGKTSCNVEGASTRAPAM